MRPRAPPPIMQVEGHHVVPHHVVPSDDGGGDVLVLGAGWVGSRLALQLQEDGCGVCVTNRPTTVDPNAKNEYFRPVPLPEAVPRYAFDLADESTWAALPPPRVGSWGFALEETTQRGAEADVGEDTGLAELRCWM